MGIRNIRRISIINIEYKIVNIFVLKKFQNLFLKYLNFLCHYIMSKINEKNSQIKI
jgi:hypothetical protein